MKEVNCRNCDNLQTDYPIKVVDIPAVNVFDDDGNVWCRDCDSIIKGGFIKW